MQGDDTINTPAVYGVKGVPNPNNTPGGLYEAANWIDLDGNFWIFGGTDQWRNESSDLWKYDPSINMWTWVNGPGILEVSGNYGTLGIPSSSNYPGSRGWGCVTWTDITGNLWLYGGEGWDNSDFEGNLNDLWKYNIITNQWTWMHGSKSANQPPIYGNLGQPSFSNTPGGIHESTSGWVSDNNELWLFGGQLWPTHYNNMWKYDIDINQWTWVKGPQNGSNPGNYGQLLVETTSNLPPPRNSYANWKDSQGNFYIWGGGNSQVHDVYGDVWRFNPSNNNWTWIAGDSLPDRNGNYQQRCIKGVLNQPMSRYENRTPQSQLCTNIFYGYAGFHLDNQSSSDLWVFSAQSNEWTWVHGDNSINSSGNYGQLGIPSVNNIPPSRGGACSWIDNDGALWIWGGMNSGRYNDMWKFIRDTSCFNEPLNLTKLTGYLFPKNICIGQSTELYITGPGNIQISPLDNAIWIDSNRIRFTPLSTTTYTISAQTDCKGNDTIRTTIHVFPQPLASFHVSQDTVYLSDPAVTLTNTSTDYESELWYLNGQVVNISNNGVYQFMDTGNYCFTLEVFNPGYSDTMTHCITVLKRCFEASIQTSSICTGDSSLLVVSTPQVKLSPSSGIKWIDSLSAWLFPSLGANNYTLTAPNMCRDTFLFTINAYSHPVANFLVVPTSLSLSQPTVSITNNSTNFDSLIWYLDESEIIIPENNQYEFIDSGNYILSLVAINLAGCSDTASSQIMVYDINNTIAIPEAFTPNGDGSNDYFLIFGTLEKISSFQMQIFNRWGEKIFNSNDPNFKWDGSYKGRKQNAGVFVYDLTIFFDDESEYRKYNGNITLIR